LERHLNIACLSRSGTAQQLSGIVSFSTEELLMRTLMIPLAAVAMTAGVPAAAQSWSEVERSRQRLYEERRELQMAQRYGSPRDVREERREYDRARREYHKDARDWQRGRNYSWNRPDPRYGGYYADNYYRSGDYYRPRPLGVNDRIYRGRDNRYYCRRSDGTTGLVVGALGGGVLGNIIAPGGSKTLGSILGGGLGAVLGSSIDRNNVTCR
jgi:Ni/Co efflux regulator RcnB